MMAGKLVTLNLGNGDLYRGFETVTVRLSQLNQTLPRQWTGVLPSRAELAELYKRWRLLYSALLHRLNVSTRLEIAAEGVENVSQSEFDQLCDQLRGEINHWLNSGSFRGVVEELRTELSTTDEIRLLVETNDQILQRLPWHLWKFFESYPKAEVGISAPDYRQFALPAAKSSTGKIRILAILGNSQGLDLNKDWEALSQLSKQGQAEIKILFQPPLNQLNDQLWNKGWDILFFAGHSFTQGKGILRINQNDSLSLDKLKHALDKSIERGLKLAIFNSCDGIGLAQALFDLHIPQVIVMREEVPDAVAHQFLPNFLVSFFDRRSLFMAVREARERLESLQNTYHCASWLPVIYQNPAAEPLVFPTVSAKPRLWPVVLTSIVVALFCIGVRQVGLLQPLDLWAYDQLMRLRPSEGQDNRLLVVEVTAEDLKYQNEKRMSRQGSLSDDALAQLLQVLEAHFPKAVGLDIYRDFKATPALAALLQKQDQFVAVCKVSAPKDDPGVEPPPELTPEQLGFSDVVTDLSDNVLRRHLLTMGEIQPDSLCGAQEAFSLKLALNYLAAQGIFPERKTPEQHLKLDRTVFAPLSPVQNGGYNSWDRRTEGGEQILLNYRSSMNDIARRVHLSELLKGGEVLKLIEGRVVLIGVTAPSQKDDFVTPYSTSNAPDQRIRGIMLQAQMVSQILSAVLDNRPLIWVWPMWGEVIWIGSWSLMGGLLAWQVRSHRRLMFWAAIAVLTLACLCGLIFLVGGWVPLIPCGLVLVSSSIMISAREKRV